VAGGEIYTLTITENTANRADYTPHTGDTYVLIIFGAGGEKKSSGTVTADPGKPLNLRPSTEGAPDFTVTVAGSGITAMTGTITFDEGGGTAPAPTDIEQFPEQGNPSTLTITGIPGQYNGKYVWGEINGNDIYFSASGVNNGFPLAQIKNGTVVLFAYTDASGEEELYTGSETFTDDARTPPENKALFDIAICEGISFDETYVALYNTKVNTSVTFTNGTATLSFSELEEKITP
jgi:hypothetical protein